jgi:hypothetical protein
VFFSKTSSSSSELWILSGMVQVMIWARSLKVKKDTSTQTRRKKIGMKIENMERNDCGKKTLLDMSRSTLQCKEKTFQGRSLRLVWRNGIQSQEGQKVLLEKKVLIDRGRRKEESGRGSHEDKD